MRSSTKVKITEDLSSKLLTVLKMALTPKIERKPADFYYGSQFLKNYNKPFAVTSVGQDCVKLLNECLSSHRYNEAVDLLWIVCQDVSIDNMYLLKASLIVLKNLEVDKEEIFEKIVTLFRSSKRLPQKNINEVCLEYIVQALIHQCDDLTIQLENMYPPRGRFLKPMEKENRLLVNLFEGYCTYIKCQELCDSSSNEDSTSLDKAILKIHSLISNPGNWDIFVLKIVEALKKFHREEDIRNLLCNYAEQQPHNLNAHIYFCSYLEENDPSSEELVKHLKEIAKLSPSDERVLHLLKKWKTKDLTYFEALNLIFMFLDYPTNGKNIRAWKIFKKLLKHAKESNDKKCQKSVKTHWKSRRKHWLWIHFNSSEISESNNDTLVSMKKKVLLLLDENHKCTKTE